MKREFEFRKDRKSLADEIRTQRKSGKSKEEIKNALNQIQGTEKYQDAKNLHALSRALPHGIKDKVSESVDAADNPEKWDVIDIRHLIPEKYRSLIDLELLIETNDRSKNKRYSQLPEFAEETYSKHQGGREKERFNDPAWVENQNRLQREREEFFDFLTDGRFLDPRNFNHFVTAQDEAPTTELKNKPFDRYSNILPNQITGAFWISTYGNGYAFVLHRPLVIFSPFNPSTRKFIEKDIHTHGEYDEKFVSKFLKAEDLPWYEHSKLDYDFTLKVTHIKKSYPSGGVTWMDVADCIVDLKAGKMWTRKYSEAEKREVEEDIAKYRAGQV